MMENGGNAMTDWLVVEVGQLAISKGSNNQRRLFLDTRPRTKQRNKNGNMKIR